MAITKKLAATIASLADKRGRLTPRMVVDEARSVTSPLHKFFEWDDSIAAEAWRIEQARDLIKRVKIVLEVEDKKVRVVAYVRDADKGCAEPGYRALLQVEKKTARMVMADELERILELLARAKAIAMVKKEDLPRLFVDRIVTVERNVKEIQDQL